MRTPIIISIILLLFSIDSFGQNCSNPIWRFDFSGSNRNTYQWNGKIFNSSIWVVVKNNGEDTTFAALWTDEFNLPQSECSQAGNVVDINIRMDMLGQPAPLGDFINTHIYCDSVEMVNDTIFGGDPGWPPIGSSVRTETYTIPCAYPSGIYLLIVIMSTDGQNGFKIFNGDACGMECYVPVLLPIKLSNLSGTLVNDEAHFDIDVYSDGSNFEPEVVLENSSDGINFSPVSTSIVQDNEAYHIVFRDPSSFYPYYRVRAIDENGEISYSNIVSLDSKSLTPTLSISPNPVSAGEFIRIAGIDEIAGANLYNVQGGYSVDCTALVQASAKGQQRLELPANLARGMYLLEVQSTNNTIHRNSLIVH